MKIEKDEFFKIIDVNERFNSKTREDYWNFFVEKCDQDIETLYRESGALYPEKEGIHQYVKFSIDKYFEPREEEEKEQELPKPPSKSEESKISPIDEEWKKKPATTWNRNFDVKGK